MTTPKLDPLLIDVPDTITTRRLILRPPGPGDGAMIAEAVRESLPQLKPWMPWAQDNYNLEDAELWCRRSISDRAMRAQLQYAILRQEDRRYLGGIGAFALKWKVPACEIGYWLRSSCYGHGYMTEAVEGLTRLMIDSLKFRRIEIRMDSRNQRSRNVADRAGYTLEGTMRNHDVNTDGELRDTCLYARVP